MPSSAVLWIAALMAMALAVPLGLFVVLRVPRRRRQIDDLPTQWPLVSRPVFGGAERRLYRQLADALPHHVILAKLPLVRLCQPADPDPAKVRYWFRLLGGTHVSFAVCDAQGRVLAAVDLISDRARPSQRSQRIKAAVLHACQVRYLTCTPDALPALSTLRALVPQPFAEPSGAAELRGPHPLAAAPGRPPDAAASEFDDSFFLPPGDSVLGELAATASANAPRARH
jgi:hypothetical protein